MRWIVRILGVLVVAAIVFVAGIFLLPKEQVARVLEARIEAATGRKVEFEGGVRPSFYPQIGLRTGPVRIANASWSKDGPILAAEGLNVAIDFVALMRGDIEIGDITAIRPRLLLETDADGRVNWNVFEANDAEEATDAARTGPNAKPARKISLQNLSLSDAAIRFVDGKTGENMKLENFDLTVTAPDLEGAARIDMQYRSDKHTVALTATIAQTARFLGGEMSEVSLEAKAAGSTMTFRGQASAQGAADGAILANIKSTADLMQLFGLAKVDLPKGLGRSGELSTALRIGADNVIHLNDLNLLMEGNPLTGALSITPGKIPEVNGNLSLGRLSTGSARSGTAVAGRSEATDAWPKARIDASPLAMMNGDLSLSVGQADLGALSLRKLAGRLRIDRARAVLDITSAQGFGGTVSGTFVANNRNGLSVSANARAKGVQVQNMLKDVMGYDRLSGTAEARIKVLGVGNSVDAIVRSLKGDGEIDVRDGEIFGLELARLFLGQGKAGGSTIFDRLGGSFVIQKGVLKNSDLAARLPSIGLNGAGEIDLGAQRINYRLTPVLPKTAGGREVVFPVTVKGPWQEPKVAVDLETAIKKTFEAEIKAEKKKVKKKVEEEVGRQLGVTTNQGENLEDAVRRKVEDEVRKGILDLLNR